MRQNLFLSCLGIAFLLTSLSSCLQTEDGTRDRKGFSGPEEKIKVDSIARTQQIEDKNYTQSTELPLFALDVSSFKAQVAKHPYTWVVVFASWCPHCQGSMPQYVEMAKEMAEDSIYLLPLAQNEDMAAIKNVMYDASWRDTVYRMDPSAFAGEEFVRSLAFRKAVCTENCKSEKVGVPHHYLFNQKGESLFLKVGDIDVETFKEAIAKAEK